MKKTGVLDLIGWIEDEIPFFGWNDLCGLAPYVEHLGNRWDKEKQSAVFERFKELPLEQRAPCIFNIFLQQYNNGGVEQFVWNYVPIASKVAESFHVIGAKKVRDSLYTTC